MPDPSPEADRKRRRLSVLNLSRMGHCAPTVMKTLLDGSDIQSEWLVKLTAGLPGGIGNTGEECGGLTAPLVLLGLRHGDESDDRGLPEVVSKGHHLLGASPPVMALRPRQIRGSDRLPLRCVSVVTRAPAFWAQALAHDGTAVLSGEQRAAYLRLQEHWRRDDFHCARAVFHHLAPLIPETDDLRRAISGFMGGTVFTGMTCSAFTAGVMALGLALGEIENSRLRVLRMLGIMAIGGDAFKDGVNAFNRVMNLGHRLSQWFAGRFGSTRCRTITQCDFSTTEGVERYVASGGTARCRGIAEQVAQEVRSMISQARSADPLVQGSSPVPPLVPDPRSS